MEAVLVFYDLIDAGISASSDEASAKRRQRPPPTEKKDLNVSGVQAKVLASKKRKEEFKEEISRLRERGEKLVEGFFLSEMWYQI
ncbi:hypothetical protein IEQ34_009044 [Dendrobium chrysotoxum]|uniref:Uncharacterized protein n=1 Tax=Dendrobium chrysotoxum TaxID=161865 RepID=A0AAV7H0A9_DENCH|nr:hypothetical protein IEQ34_009044 [Dendrobium chrysotoxum]